MTGIRLRPVPGTQVPALFTQLTRPELLVLSAKLASGHSRVRMAGLSARTVADAWGQIRLASLLARLEDEVGQELARR